MSAHQASPSNETYIHHCSKQVEAFYWVQVSGHRVASALDVAYLAVCLSAEAADTAFDRETLVVGAVEEALDRHLCHWYKAVPWGHRWIDRTNAASVALEEEVRFSWTLYGDVAAAATSC